MIGLRLVTPEDDAFLAGLYVSTRAEEFAALGWGAAQLDAFLGMQFAAQRRSYAEQAPNAHHHIILRDGESAGRLYVDRRAAEICLMDIALLPQHRGEGIGTALLGALLAEAALANKPVRLHVEVRNRAVRLYERVGFTRVSTDGVYCRMERPPTSPT